MIVITDHLVERAAAAIEAEIRKHPLRRDDRLPWEPPLVGATMADLARAALTAAADDIAAAQRWATAAAIRAEGYHRHPGIPNPSIPTETAARIARRTEP